MKIVFFGTPPTAAKVLQHLIQCGVEVAAVISKPDRPKGRSGTPAPTPVKEVALAFHIPVYQPEVVSAPEFAEVLKSYAADLFVVVAYGEILKEHLLQIPKKGCINLHYSLLPKYRGAAPMQWSIIKGDKVTGVTVLHMVKKMDAGDMLKTVEVPIGENTTFGELEETLTQTGKMALLEVIRAFEKGEPTRQPQDHALATLAPKIELEDCQIDWGKSAQEIHNLVRGVNPYPGAWCFIDVKGEKKRLKISKTRVVPAENISKGNLVIAAGDQALELLEVQLEGKKSMSSAELIRGTSFKFCNTSETT